MDTKTVTITGWIVYDGFRAKHSSLYASPFSFQEYEPTAGSDCVVVRAHSHSFDAPLDFDPRPQLVKALEVQIRAKNAEAAKFETDTRREIQTLLAISCEVA